MTIHRFAIALLVAFALAGCEEAAKPQPGGREASQMEHPMPKSSSAGLPDGNPAVGQQLATRKGATGQACADCHGADGNTPIDPSYPLLAGQYEDYLAHTLLGYRDGRREHALMTPQAKPLTDQQIADLSAYFASQKGKLVDMEGAHN